MVEVRAVPSPGEIWRHFKGNLYKIVCIAQNTEIESDKRVIYQKYNNEDKTFYDRSLSMFMSYTDRKKYPINEYPEYDQEYRFVKVDDNGIENKSE